MNWTGLAAAAIAASLHCHGAVADNYRLFPRDLIGVSVFGEPDMDAQRRINGDGSVTLPLIGRVDVRGLTVADAEAKIQHVYLDRQFFVHPEVTISVLSFAAKEVSVMGQVKNPGAIAFPPEVDQLSVVDVISRAGGFTRIGRADHVRITRRDADGRERSFTVDVKDMMDGRGGGQPFMLRPEDVVFVPETLF